MLMPQTYDNARTPYPPSRYAWYVALVLTLCYAGASVDRLIIGMLTPAIQRSLHLSDTQVGLIQGLAFFLFYTVFGLPIGHLVDRRNRQRILGAGIVAWSAMTALCAFAAGFPALFAGRVGVGVGEASLNPAATSILGDYFPEASRAKAFGLYGAGSGLGSILAFTGGGLVYGWLQKHQVTVPVLRSMAPWQVMFILVALPGLITAPLLIFTVREPLRRRVTETKSSAFSDVLAFFRRNKMTILSHHIGIGLLMAPLYGMFTWLPTMFLRVYGWTPANFGVAFGIPGGLLGMGGALSAGFLAVRLKGRGDKAGTLRACLIGGAVCLMGNTFAPLMPNPWLSLIVILGGGMFSTYPIVLGYTAITEFAPNEMRARFTATFLLCTGSISATLGPLFVGMISDALPHNPHGIAFALFGVGVGMGLPGWLLLAAGMKSYKKSLSDAALVSALTEASHDSAHLKPIAQVLR